MLAVTPTTEICPKCSSEGEIIFLPSDVQEQINSLNLSGDLHRETVCALHTYWARVGGTPDAFEGWGDDALITVDVESFTAAGETHHTVRNPQSIGESARQFLAMALDWWRAVVDLAEAVTPPGSIAIPDELNRLVTTEARAVLAGRDKVLVSWARLTLGTAGPTPTDLGGYVETSGTSIYLDFLPRV